MDTRTPGLESGPAGFLLSPEAVAHFSEKGLCVAQQLCKSRSLLLSLLPCLTLSVETPFAS